MTENKSQSVNPEQSQVLSEVDSNAQTESNPPLAEVDDNNKTGLNKNDMCQLIYYDFSLK